jgi:BASS family bile acid:Na+ symporter
MKTAVSVIVPALSFLLLMAVGLDLTSIDFERVRRQKALVSVGLFAPLVLLPPIALGLIELFQPARDVAAGLLLLAACPIGGISNTFSYLARASPALSVTLTGFSCLLAGVTIPLLSTVFERALGRPLGFEAPFAMLAAQVLVLLVVPVALGMWIRRRSPQVALRHGPRLRQLAFLGIGAVLGLVVLDDAGAFVERLSTMVPLAAAFVAAAAVGGWITASFVTRDARDRFTIAVEFGTRNVAVATAIAVTLLGHVEFARLAATYFLTELPLMLTAVGLFRALSRK